MVCLTLITMHFRKLYCITLYNESLKGPRFWLKSTVSEATALSTAPKSSFKLPFRGDSAAMEWGKARRDAQQGCFCLGQGVRGVPLRDAAVCEGVQGIRAQ